MALLTGVLVACGAGPTGTPRGPDRIAVVATTTQVGALAAEIGGDAVDLTILLEPGVEAHDFEMTPAQAAALEDAELVLMSGAGLEDWLQDSLAAASGSDPLRDMSEGIALRPPEREEQADTREDANDDDGGAEPTPDPHYWLSGPNAIAMAENVRDALAAAEPSAASAFEERAAGVVARLEEADAEVRRLIGEVPPDRRKIVTDHDALGYFVDEYGLEFVGSVFPSLDVSSEPSAREIEELIAAIRTAGVAAIFTESSVNPRLAAAVADETDAQLVDEPLYTDSLGPEGSGADTLDGMLLHNARVFRDGLLSE